MQDIFEVSRFGRVAHKIEASVLAAICRFYEVGDECAAETTVRTGN